MQKSDSLIILVKSMTKAEKKAFKSGRKSSAYIDLFDIIDKEDYLDGEKLIEKFTSVRPETNLSIAINYLYKLLLDSLVALREKNDLSYLYMNQINKSRVLFEKGIYEDALGVIRQVMKLSQENENYSIYLIAAQYELEYLLYLNFPETNESDLTRKYFKINEAINIVKKINEQLSLYQMLRHRVMCKGNIRSLQQQQSLYDLVISEMSIIQSLKNNSFEIKKLHQLFQANYMISVGDYKSAFHSYSELNKLFESNMYLVNNSPQYYFDMLEGILDSLRSIKDYESMHYFIDKLKTIRGNTVAFELDVDIVMFLYSLYPLLDNGRFEEAKQILDEKKYLTGKVSALKISRQAEVYLYISIIYIGLYDYKNARKYLSKVMTQSKLFDSLPLYRTIRLINLIVLYELNKIEVMQGEIRSIRREISKVKKAYRTEKLMLYILNKRKSDLFFGQRIKIWNKMESEIEQIREDVFEKQLLMLFDFTAWIESKLTQVSLSEILQK